MIVRIFLYASIMIAYSSFMASHALGGFGWHDYHAYRVFNSVEYLRLNGYFTNYGFSILSSCANCDLSEVNWVGRIYLSWSALAIFWPYLIVNHFLGRDALLDLGPLFDKSAVFLTAVLVAELLIRLVGFSQTRKGNVSIDEGTPPIPYWWLGVSVFTLFITSIWAYQMQRAMWNDLWFLLLFCLSLLALLRSRFLLGCCFILAAGLMHYISAFFLAFILMAFSVFSILFRERSVLMSYIPRVLHQHRRLWSYSLCALVPAIIYLALRALYKASSGEVGQGSSLLYRIGISGDDIHNGGIVGALQFMGGVRVSQCISMLGTEGLQGAHLMSKISAFNCSLSIVGMFLLSSLSVLGVIWLLRTKPATRPLIFPVAMILLVTVSVLQQSLSVHLLGHSYPFALLFACGLVGLCLKGAELIQSRSLSLIVFTPVVVACVLLSIRVSMLSGVPG